MTEQEDRECPNGFNMGEWKEHKECDNSECDTNSYITCLFASCIKEEMVCGNT